ncbi:hypothetical protein [Paenibacillus polymyxa]|uniref:hypothetical protein n=2 Tax=Paenibacillus polymyxa TaxID=1406 RepID=UPI0025B65317|nr:hypothetical protein [Paenibacillus polymyxa]MDN4090915.1 hypothetical protein [Paenibacillus polymyxa]
MWVFKSMFILWVGIAIIILSTDRYVAYAVREHAGRSIEQSLDGGIIASGYVTDAQNGYVQLEEKSLEQAARLLFRKNMNLDSNLENRLMKGSDFKLKLTHDTDGVPWVEVEFHTHVSFFFGDHPYPINVARKIGYESIYK